MTDTSLESHNLSIHLEQLALMVVMLTEDDVPGLGAFLAQLEELQNNRDHAIKLYREIIEKDPESEYAGKARKRLDVLKQAKH